MQCPRCQAAITSAPDATGALTCASCGARLLTKAAAAAARAAAARQPEGSAPEAPHPSATLPPGTPLKKIPRPEELVERSAADASRSAFEAILVELKALRSVQDDILELLSERQGFELPRLRETPAPLGGDFDDAPPPAVAPLRARRAKTVVVIDDDAQTRAAVVAELERAAVPVRAFADGQAGLQAIAEEKPDVIALELDLLGPMAGKDVINMIKATMEWVDIPIVLYTRAKVESQREARTVHGADEFVLKASGPAALVTRCIALFRKG
jgi:CheY-like chemotaxis protein/DNA-directed RNA polymerase subunit RPC12/RpoP